MIRAELTGLKELTAKLQTLAKPGKITPILRKAVKKGDKIVWDAAKANVRALSFKDSLGLLLKSLGEKTGVSRKGVVFGVVGPRTGYKAARGAKGVKQQTAIGLKYEQAGRDPTKYAHLIEGGVRPHATGRGSKLARLRKKGGMSQAVQGGRQHPGFAARPFLRPAYERNKARIEEVMAAEIGAGITKLAQG